MSSELQDRLKARRRLLQRNALSSSATVPPPIETPPGAVNDTTLFIAALKKEQKLKNLASIKHMGTSLLCDKGHASD